MTEPTDPTTADAAAERVQAVLDARPQDDRPAGHILYTLPGPDRTRERWLHLTEPDLRVLLAERVRMAVELEQVCDDVDSFRARRDNAVAQGDASEAEARELAQALITAQAKNLRLLDRALAAEAEAKQLRDATLEAAGLLQRLAGPGPCDYDGDGACRGHDGFASGYLAPCPHPAGRRFVETWGTQASATDGADHEGAQKGPESHAEAFGRDLRPPA